MVNRDGVSCLVPMDRDPVKEITGYKMWEVAFKVFMGIYNSKWPNDANQLLQYSHIIQTASLTYPWENVYNYDIAFREIKTDNPDRLWGMICQHTWSLELGEPTSKTTHQGLGSAQPMQSQPRNANPNRRICWKFNKG